MIDKFAKQHGLTDHPITSEVQPGLPELLAFAQGLASLDLLLTGRYHAVCLALATRTPFMAITSNTPKIESLLRDVFGTSGRVRTTQQIGNFDLRRPLGWTEAEVEALDRFESSRKAAYAAIPPLLAGIVAGQPQPGVPALRLAAT